MNVWIRHDNDDDEMNGVCTLGVRGASNDVEKVDRRKGCLAVRGHPYPFQRSASEESAFTT